RSSRIATLTARSRTGNSCAKSRESAADCGSVTGRASLSNDAGWHIVLWITRHPGVGLGEIDRNVTAFQRRPRRQLRRRQTWSSPGPGVGIRFWVGGNWARVAALPRIGGDPADV